MFAVQTVRSVCLVAAAKTVPPFADSSIAWDVSFTSFAHPASQSASVGE